MHIMFFGDIVTSHNLLVWRALVSKVFVFGDHYYKNMIFTLLASWLRLLSNQVHLFENH
jgi:hypothetical protein